MEFELLDHPADIGFRVRGATLKELYSTAAEALVSLILDSSNINLLDDFVVYAEGSDLESLLVNWLNEVLYLVDSRRVALGRFDVLRFENNRIESRAKGEPRNPEKHPPRVVVKAVTYHQLKIEQTAGGWLAEVYVDV